MVRRKCCIPSCKTKDGSSRENTEIFTIPDDKVLLEEWYQIMKIRFAPKKFICEKHFKHHYIRERTHKEDIYGNILLNVSIDGACKICCCFKNIN